jgi:hypothetical protein
MPAAAIRWTTSSSKVGTWSAKTADPKLLRTPFVALRSLIAVGTPASGPSPTGRAERACSPVTVTKAPSSSA